MRTPVRKRRKGGPRRGRIVDPGFMQFCRDMGCVLRGRHRCFGRITFHHVRLCGSPKNDRHGFGLCEAAHLHDFGEYSIERLGKRKWQAHWHVDIETEIARLTLLYRAWIAQKGKVA